MRGARGHGDAKVPPGHRPSARQLKLGPVRTQRCRGYSSVPRRITCVLHEKPQRWLSKMGPRGCTSVCGPSPSMPSAPVNVNHTTEAGGAGRMCFMLLSRLPVALRRRRRSSPLDGPLTGHIFPDRSGWLAFCPWTLQVAWRPNSLEPA